MEPFGLFDLLKTLVSPAENKDEIKDESVSAPTQKQPIKAQPPEELSIENACWTFMQQHDKRAKNTKKRPY